MSVEIDFLMDYSKVIVPGIMKPWDFPQEFIPRVCNQSSSLGNLPGVCPWRSTPGTTHFRPLQFCTPLLVYTVKLSHLFFFFLSPLTVILGAQLEAISAQKRGPIVFHVIQKMISEIWRLNQIHVLENAKYCECTSGIWRLYWRPVLNEYNSP